VRVTHGLILKKQDRGEADEVVVFLSRELGWLRGVAKNAKKSRFRFGGHLESFSLVELVIRSRKKDDMVWIDDAQVLQGFLGIRPDIAKVARAAYFLELASAFLPEGQPDPDLFDFLCRFLTNLENAPVSPLQFLIQEVRLLGLLGYAPRFDACPVCEKTFVPGEDAVFSLTMGGACHLGCVDVTERGKLLLSPDTLAVMRRGLELQTEAASRLRLSNKGRQELRSVLTAFVRQLRGKELNSLAFLENMKL
jgi:DNA repair protein RecO (recombination protein O)